MNKDELKEYNRIKQKEQWIRDRAKGLVKTTVKVHYSWLDELRRIVETMKEPK